MYLVKMGIGTDDMEDIIIQHRCSMDGISYGDRILVQKIHCLSNIFNGYRQDRISNIFQEFTCFMGNIFFTNGMVSVKYLLEYFCVSAYLHLCRAYLLKDSDTWGF